MPLISKYHETKFTEWMKVQNEKGKQSACLDNGITYSGSLFVIVLILLLHVCNLSESIFDLKIYRVGLAF